MLDSPRVIALPAWSIQKRGRYWYIIKPSFFTEQEILRGPYSSVTSACLMIARELAREAVKKHNR